MPAKKKTSTETKTNQNQVIEAKTPDKPDSQPAEPKIDIIKKDDAAATSDKLSIAAPTDAKPKTVKSKKQPTKASPKKKTGGKGKKMVKKSAKKTSAKKPKKTTKKVTKKKVKDTKKKIPPIFLTLEKRTRYFKLIFNGEPKGRFAGNKPKQAANKALTSIIKDKSKNGEKVIDVDIKFSLKECTRWNKKKCKKGTNGKVDKIYNYVGKREPLSEQIIVDHVQKETDASILKSGKITKELKLDNGNVKYYMDVKEKGVDNKDIDKHIVVKKVSVIDAATGKPSSAVKYIVVNEIKYKFTNKVQKLKQEQQS